MTNCCQCVVHFTAITMFKIVYICYPLTFVCYLSILSTFIYLSCLSILSILSTCSALTNSLYEVYLMLNIMTIALLIFSCVLWCKTQLVAIKCWNILDRSPALSRLTIVSRAAKKVKSVHRNKQVRPLQ